MLLAINLTIKKTRLPEHIRFLKFTYTVTGFISGFLEEKILASILISAFNDTLIKITREYDTAIIGINQTEQ
jgi:hypothetical protein